MEHNTEHNTEQPIFQLPYELHIKIFESLHIRHIRKLSLTCSKFKDLMKDKYLIKKILIQMKEPLQYIDNPVCVLYDIAAINNFGTNMDDTHTNSLITSFGIINNNICITCPNDYIKENTKIYKKHINFIKNIKHLKICKKEDFEKHNIEFTVETIVNVFMENMKRYLKMIQFIHKIRNHCKELLFLPTSNIDEINYTDFVFTIYSHYHNKFIHILFDASSGGFLYECRGGKLLSKQYYILSDSNDIPQFNEFKTNSTSIILISPYDYTGNINIQGRDFYLECAWNNEGDDWNPILVPEDYDENGNLIQDEQYWEDYD